MHHQIKNRKSDRISTCIAVCACVICVADVRILVGVVALKHALQMSDSVEEAAFLAFLAELWTPIPHLVRGGVFAYAQTETYCFFGINLTSGSFESVSNTPSTLASLQVQACC